MARLPVPGSDENTWGQVLNAFLEVEHNSDGSLKSSGSLATKPTLTSAATVTVGNGGQYPTINAAIAALSRLYPLYEKNGFAVTISLLAGFTMAEQVFVRGIDLSWITITSVDAEVPVDPLAITESLLPLGATNTDDLIPIFGGIENAHLPVIATLFAYPDQGDGYAAAPKDGVAVTHNSHVLFKPGAGVRRPRSGLKVLYNSSATCYMPGLTQGGAGTGAGTVTGVNFTYATRLALHVGYGSKANLARSQLHHSKGSYGAYVIWGSHVDLYQSQINDTVNGYAITCRDGSYANMRETTVARSVRGYHALHNARINARSHPNMWTIDSAKDCTGYGILASYNSHIDASEVDVSGSAVGVNASNASSVNFDIAYANNCTTRGVSAVGSSIIDAQGTVANTLTTGTNSSPSIRGVGFYAQNGSTINARDTGATRCVTGYYAVDGSTINANNAHADNSTTGFYAQAGSCINADSSFATLCTDAYKAIETSEIQARNSSADGASHYCFWSERSSRINARGSSAKAVTSPSAIAPLISFYAFEGGDINAQNTNAQNATTGYHVDRDGRINAGARQGSPVGTTNQAANLRTGKGLISDADAKVPGVWMVESGIGASITNDLNEIVLATLTIPAGALGPNGVIRLTVNFSCTNNANTKTCRVRFGGISGTQYLNSALVSQARLHTPVMIYNRNSESSQIGGSNAGNQNGYGQSTTAQVTSTLDTSVAQTLVITGQLATATDTVALESYTLEYHYQA